MKKKVEKFIEKLYIYVARRSSKKVIKNNLKRNFISLTRKEKKEVNNVWKKLNVKIDYSFFILCKNKVGFDSRYLPEDLYNPIIKAALNPAMQSVVFENKCLYDKFFPDVNRPKTICKNIYGCFYDGNDNYISEEDAINLILKYDAIIIKPGLYSDSGNSVKKVQPEIYNQIKLLFAEYNSNFIVQTLVKQSSETAIFNPESVNTMRITSLYLNGKTSIISSAFRCGQKGATVDNTGAGGIIVGIDENGYLHEKGFDLQMSYHFQSSNGIKFKSHKITGYNKAIEVIQNTHKRFQTVHLIGWDFAIDENNNPVLIEVNIAFPGIIFEQLCSGPLFGERTQEVIDYVVKNKPTLRIRM
ncbi:MAG: sugar-transfer associated ATP-grasp domain-containing protein [Bacteroidales bacterium]